MCRPLRNKVKIIKHVLLTQGCRYKSQKFYLPGLRNSKICLKSMSNKGLSVSLYNLPFILLQSSQFHCPVFYSSTVTHYFYIKRVLNFCSRLRCSHLKNHYDSLIYRNSIQGIEDF